MNNKWKKPRTKKGKAKKTRRVSQALKVYRTSFTQQAAYLVTKTTGLGTANSITGYNVGSVSPALIGPPVTAKSGFADFYDFAQSFQFKLQDLKNAQFYTQIYDQWRLDSISITVQCMSTQAQIGNLTLMPTLYMATDFDDAGIVTGLDGIVGRSGYRRFQFGQKAQNAFTFTLKPKRAALMYNDVTSLVGYSSPANGWNDCNDPQITYYGIKAWFTDVWAPNSNTVNTAFKIDVKYNLAFRTPISAC